MKIIKRFDGLVLVLATTLLLSGCSMQAPGNVLIVTPTVIKAAANGAPDMHLAVAQVNSATPVPPTPIPLSMPTNGAVPASDVTPMATYGPVVGPNYTPATPVPVTPATVIPITPAVTVLPGTATAVTPTTPTVTPTPGPSSTPLPTLARDFVGIQIHGYLNDAEWQKMLDRAKVLGVSWIKVQVLWKQMAPARGTTNDIFQTLVLDVQRAHTQGFKTLLSVDSAPDWARGAGPLTSDGPPADPQDLASFISTLVMIIKPEFIDALEVWNEPNLRSEWNTPGVALNGATYLKYFDAAYQSIRHTESLVTPTFGTHHITIIAAAPATGTSNTANTVGDRDWLKQLYAAGLAHYGTDIAIGAHPYGWGNAPESDCCKQDPGVAGWNDNRAFFFKDTLDDYRQIMVTNHHDAAKLWVTEFGWGTYDGLHRSDASPAGQPSDPSFGWLKLLNKQQQADYTIRAFLMASRPPYSSFVGPMMLWNLNFGTIPQMIDTGRQEAGFSLLDFDGSPRPVFSELAAAPKQ
jgi:hypothetical protein